MKAKPLLLPDDQATYLVIGATREAQQLAYRIGQQLTPGQVSYSPQFHRRESANYIYSAVPVHPRDFVDRSEIRAIYPIVPSLVSGATASQKLLTDGDWQTLRDIERQLLAMHDAGIWALPEDVRQRLLDREQMRTEVDNELQEQTP
ncbi:hypothetical protein [Endozoicomonas sp. ALB091]|uniref:hypothetical protein n=1 Tax=Endozoicomonas sp. ALB091 TaxID=3403073 RepID=UPI003BB52372